MNHAGSATTGKAVPGPGRTVWIRAPSSTRGLSNRAIAGRLHLAHGTVKDHVSAVLAKLGGLNRVQAAVVADRADLVEAGAGRG
ncbi:hypothetical protein GCM10010270_55690 [Streptomyces violaceus]|nr:hypothetical protein GCM10010270_55690 [Streptomyces janthinus]